MSITRYKLWIDSDILGSWPDYDEAIAAVRTYVEDNPDDLESLHFGAFTSTLDRGLVPEFAYHGKDILKHFDEDENV